MIKNDAFINMQWKRATIFVKLENAGQGWPMKKNDYFSADRYIVTQRMIKLGVFWPFYTQPGKDSPTARLLRHETLKAAGYTSEEFLAKTDEILNDERQWVPFQKAVNARIDSLLQQPAPSPEKEEERKGKAPTPPIKKKPPLMPAHKGGVP